MDQPPPDDESWRYPPPPGDNVAGAAPWWRRAVAYLLDALLIGAPLGVLGVSTGLTKFVRTGDTVRVEVDPVLQFLSIVVTVVYAALMDGGPRQASVGKMAMRIQVADAATGAPIGPGRAASRRLIFLGLFYALVIPGVVNALAPLWDRRRQGWHDKAVRSIVVNAPS